jgi:hypothetical protein
MRRIGEWGEGRLGSGIGTPLSILLDFAILPDFALRRAWFLLRFPGILPGILPESATENPDFPLTILQVYQFGFTGPTGGSDPVFKAIARMALGFTEQNGSIRRKDLTQAGFENGVQGGVVDDVGADHP